MMRWYQLPEGILKKLTAIWAGFLVFAVIGCSETNLTIMVLLVAGWFGYQLVIHQKWDWFAVFLVGVAAFSCTIFFTSPGNALRMGGNPEGRNFTLSTLQSLKLMTKLSLEWMLRTPLLVFTILWVAVLPKIFEKFSPTNRYFSVPIWVSGLVFFGVLFVQIFPSLLRYRYRTRPRVINSIICIFVRGGFIILPFWSST
ncbi:MAG: hypothetical protein R2822_31540 [Spirosomataceae bacterium]